MYLLYLHISGVWGVHNKAEILQFLLKIEEEQAQFSFLITLSIM